MGRRLTLLLAATLGNFATALAWDESPAWRVANINQSVATGEDGGSDPQSLVALGDVLLFTADDGVHGRELWRSDATEQGTVLVADIRAGDAGSDVALLVARGDVVFFVADDGVHGAELWRSDGTGAGTRMVADVLAGGEGSYPDQLALVGDRVFFYADDGVHGRELWSSEGTAETTRLARDIRVGPGGSDIYDGPGYSWPVRAESGTWRGDLYFAADDGVTGIDLWRSDGTPEGTVLVADLPIGPLGVVFDMFAAGDRFFFNITGSCPCAWETDGTPEGTRPLLGPIVLFKPATTIGDAAYADGDEALWRLDLGAPASDWTALPDTGSVYDPFAIDTVLFAISARQLWRLDLGAILPPEHEDYREFDDVFATGNRILLYDEDKRDLWAANRTGDGTVRVQSLSPADLGREDYTPFGVGGFTRAGDHIFFYADGDNLGIELWALRVDSLPEICIDCPEPTPPACVGDCDGDSTVAIDEVILLVRRALGLSNAACEACGDGSSAPDLPCIIRAVRSAIDGCS